MRTQSKKRIWKRTYLPTPIFSAKTNLDVFGADKNIFIFVAFRRDISKWKSEHNLINHHLKIEILRNTNNRGLCYKTLWRLQLLPIALGVNPNLKQKNWCKVWGYFCNYPLYWLAPKKYELMSIFKFGVDSYIANLLKAMSTIFAFIYWAKAKQVF